MLILLSLPVDKNFRGIGKNKSLFRGFNLFFFVMRTN